MRLDTLLLADPGEVAERARVLEDAGFDGAYSVEGTGDPFLPLALAATTTTRLALYSNLALAFPRSPTTTAYTAWDLQRLTAGRFSLGLGTQVRANVERRYGARWTRPVSRMREFVLALRSVFTCWQEGGPLDFRGDHYQLTLMQPTFRPAPLAEGPPPILVGALGPKMTAMAAEVADGVLLHPFTSERFAREHSAVLIAEGLARARRDRGELRVVCGAIVCAGRDESELASAEAGTRALLGFYGSTPAYRPLLDLHGWGELQPELRELSRSGRWDEMAGLVDDEVLRTLAVHGSPTEAGTELARRFAGLADRVACTLPYGADPAALGELADGFRAGAASVP